MNGDQVQIQVEAAVCAEPELAALAELAAGSASQPAVPGGAAVGRVVATGDGAAHLAGRRVLVGPIDACGECERCRRGLPFACAQGRFLGRTAPGALAGEVTVRARWVTELGGGLELDGPLAALCAREAADAHALYARAGLAAGEPAVVLGRGPVASLLSQIAVARGARVLSASAGEPGGEEAAAERVRAHAAEHAAGGRPMKIFAASGGADDFDELGLALRVAEPGALVAALARPPRRADPAGVAALLAGGGALVGVPAAHPDLVPEVTALAVKGELDLAAVADLYRAEPGWSPLDRPADLAARVRASLAAGRALVIAF